MHVPGPRLVGVSGGVVFQKLGLGAGRIPKFRVECVPTCCCLGFTVDISMLKDWGGRPAAAPGIALRAKV